MLKNCWIDDSEDTDQMLNYDLGLDLFVVEQISSALFQVGEIQRQKIDLVAEPTDSQRKRSYMLKSYSKG